MSTPHLEVVPRIIDTSIAAAYQTPLDAAPKSSVEQKLTEGAQDQSSAPIMIVGSPPTFTERFFSTLKDYIIPILFIIAVAAVIYVGWKYWTTYRIGSAIVAGAAIPIDSNQPEPMINPEKKASNEELAKYLLSTASSDGDNESVHSKLSTIDEGAEPRSSQEDSESLPPLESDSDEASDTESDAEDDVEDNADVESVISEPDFNMISSLINQPMDEFANGLIDYTSYDDATSVNGSICTEVDTEEAHEEPLPQPIRKSKKSKRVVL